MREGAKAALELPTMAAPSWLCLFYVCPDRPVLLHDAALLCYIDKLPKKNNKTSVF